jgi:hypothetical protein
MIWEEDCDVYRNLTLITNDPNLHGWVSQEPGASENDEWEWFGLKGRGMWYYSDKCSGFRGTLEEAQQALINYLFGKN